MKILSLWQPHATAISLGLKTIETRSFYCNYRGPLAIHATKHSPVESLALSLKEPLIYLALFKHYAPFREVIEAATVTDGNVPIPLVWPRTFRHIFPAGALLCVAELVDCLPTVGTRIPAYLEATVEREDGGFRRYPPVLCRYPKRGTPLEIALGNYAPGRFGWVLECIQPLPTPIPYSGHQGLRDLDPATEKRVLAALKGKL